MHHVPRITPLFSFAARRLQRDHIIHRVDNDKIIVIIVAIGIRKEGDKTDIYRLTQKLLKLGLLE